MFNLANATRCSLVFALLMLFHSFRSADEIAGLSASAGRCSAVLEDARFPDLERDSLSLPERTFDATPVVGSNDTNSDLQGTHRRSNENRTQVSRLRCIRSLVECKTESISRLVLTGRLISRSNSEVLACEFLMTPIHETRGKPEGLDVSALSQNSLKSLPEDTRGYQWSWNRPANSLVFPCCWQL